MSFLPNTITALGTARCVNSHWNHALSKAAIEANSGLYAMHCIIDEDEEQPPGLEQLIGSRTTSLSGVLHTDLLSRAITECTDLTSLRLTGLKRGCTAHESITSATWPRLNTLIVDRTSSDLACIIAKLVKPHRHITNIKLYCFGWFTSDNCFTTTFTQCPWLTHVSIPSGFDTNDAFLDTIIDNCPLVTSVDLSRGCTITEGGIATFARAFPALTSINLSMMRHANDTAVCAIAEHCPLLTDIDVSLSRPITDHAFYALARNCQFLTRVDLSHTLLTDSTIAALVQGCPHITQLNLYACHELTPRSFEMIANAYPRLTHLTCSLEGKTASNNSCIALIARGCRHLSLLQVSTGMRWSMEAPHDYTITDEGACNIALYSHKLEQFATTGWDISGRTLVSIVRNCPRLSALKMHELGYIEPDAIETIARTTPRLGNNIDLSFRLHMDSHRVKNIAQKYGVRVY